MQGKIANSEKKLALVWFGGIENVSI